MKKTIFYIHLLLLGLYACNNSDIDEVFDKSPDERVRQEIESVQNDLISHKEGWLATYTFNEGKTELVLHIKFMDENRASISSPELDYEKESSYILRYTQQLDLVFDTHSFLATLVDAGFKADFRWELISTEENKYHFKSRANSTEGASELVIEKSSNEKLQVALATQKFKEKMRPNPDISHFRVLELSSGERFDYLFINNMVIFQHIQGDELVSFESKITIQENGFTLTTPFVVNGKSISEFVYDDATKSFKIVNVAGETGGIYFDNSPVVIPYGIEDFWQQKLLFRPILNFKYCSSKWIEVVFDQIKEKGYSIDQLLFDTNSGVIWLNFNDDYQQQFGIRFKQKIINKKVFFEFDAANFNDDDVFNALLPLLQFIAAPNGHYFIDEGKFENYPNKAYSLISEDYPNMKMYMIEIS